VNKINNFVIFFDHDDNISDINWDDTVANPISSLPKVLSPSKVVNVELDTEEKLLDFYSDLNNICQLAGANPLGDEDNGSDTDAYFIDIDYELDEDADLLVENIDEDFIDEGVVEGTR
jgi:hypothetical protein